jgi:hypothetical protein
MCNVASSCNISSVRMSCTCSSSCSSTSLAIIVGFQLRASTFAYFLHVQCKILILKSWKNHLISIWHLLMRWLEVGISLALVSLLVDQSTMIYKIHVEQHLNIVCTLKGLTWKLRCREKRIWYWSSFTKEEIWYGCQLGKSFGWPTLYHLVHNLIIHLYSVFV